MYKLILFGLYVLPCLSYGQLQVSGIAITESGEGIPFASVLLLDPLDSSLIKGQVTNESGHYRLEDISAGDYFIKISSVGYLDFSTPIFKIKEANSPYKLGKIKLYENVALLNDVVVKAKKPLYEQKIDRTVINVASSISRAGGTALDLLQRAPGVTVDKMNKSIALSGKQGVRIMINGKISRLPMDALVEMMESMNSDNIESIELITTPSAKYDAEGDGGMINIVMKKNEDMGKNGNISLISGYGNRAKYGSSINFNSITQKVAFFSDFSFRKNFQKQYIDTQWQLLTESGEINTTTIAKRNPIEGMLNGGMGIEIDLNENTTLGGAINFYGRDWDMDAKTNILRANETRSIESLNMYTSEQNDWENISGNLNLQQKFNDDHVLSFDIDQINYRSNNPNDYLIDYFDALGDVKETGALRSGKLTKIKINTIATDFSGKITNLISYEIGAKGSFSELSNDMSVDSLQTGIWLTDSELTALADMIENIGAGYLSANIKASPNLDIQVGIRYEHTKTNINTLTEKNIVDRNFGKWFPSIFFNHRINNNNSWVASYSRRISRPSFNELAPFVAFSDPNSLWTGNIALLPAFTDAYKIEYRYKSILLSGQYSHDENSIVRFQPSISGDNKQVSTSENLNYRDNFSLVLSFPLEVTDWWEMQLNAIGNLFYIEAEYTSNTYNSSMQNLSLNSSQRFKISESITAEISGFYQTKQFWGIMEFAAFGALDFGIEKKLKRSTLRMSYSDLLGTNIWQFRTEVPSENLNSSAKINFETSIVNLTYSFRFGNDQLRKQKRKSSAQEEKERF